MESGKINIIKLELDNFGKKLDLIDFVANIDIYESIFEAYISATLSILDGAGLLDRITWAGSKVKIVYTTNEKTNPVTFNFIVDGVSYSTPNDMQKAQMYVVTMYSEEVVRGLAVRVNEIFTKQQPEIMISNILKNKLKTTKRFIAAKTGALDTINCANLRPFQAISKIQKRAVSRDKASSSFVFFENQHGYRFISIEELLSEVRNDPQVKTGDRNFYLDGIKHKNVQNTSWRQILSIEKTKLQSITDTIISGGIKKQIYAYNVSTGEYYKFEYDDNKNSSEFDTNPKSITYRKIATQDIIKTGDDVAGLNVIPITTTDELERVKKEIYVQAFISKIISNVVKMETHGDSRMTVGTGVNLNLPIIDGTTENKYSELSSGVYLVSKLHHMIIPSNQLYSQSYELIRTGMFE